MPLPNEVRLAERNLGLLSLPLAGGDLKGCGACVSRLCGALESCAGIVEARFDPSTTQVQVAFDPALVSAETIQQAAIHAESQLQTRYAHHTFEVAGMDCPNCAATLEQMAQRLAGINSASVQFSAARMRVEFDTQTTKALPSLIGEAKNLGFTLTDVAAPINTTSKSGVTAFLTSPQGQAALSIAFLALGIVAENVLSAKPIVSTTLYLLSILSGGYRFGIAAVTALRNRIVSTHLLMTLAAVGAMLANHFEEAAMVIALYAVGLGLENAAMERTRRSLQGLIAAAPAEAILQEADGKQRTVAADTLLPGQTVLVLPGSRVPADGIIHSGTSRLMEAAITGESLPVSRTVGERVFAGSVNAEGALEVTVTAAAADSTLARILHLVEEAQAQKAPAQAQVEQFGRIYTPVVLVAALLTGLLTPFILPGENGWYRALTLLVVACPCALVIATPVAYVSAIARAARSGVLIKGGIVLENLADTHHLFLDKTGTLTTGILTVNAIYPLPGITEQELLTVAAAVEQHSEHPIARAVVEHSRNVNLSLPKPTAVQAVPGRGLMASLEGQTILTGNAAFLREKGIFLSDDLAATEAQYASAGSSTLFVTREGKLLGLIAIADTVRPEAPDVVMALRKRNLSLTMLTGDRQPVAETVARAVQIDAVYGELLPADKMHRVQEAGSGTAFLGDGINDAPALSVATVGIAIGAGGTAAAIEAADMVLLRPSLALLPEAIDLARQTRRIVRTNIAIAVAAVLLLLLAAISGHLALPIGVLGHEGSALLVILNGIRLLTYRSAR